MQTRKRQRASSLPRGEVNEERWCGTNDSLHSKRVPGFDRVVFTKQAAEKLASVGDLCDAGLVCVFDAPGLKTYKVVRGRNVYRRQKRPQVSSVPLSLF